MKILLTFAFVLGIGTFTFADPNVAGETINKPLAELAVVRSHYQKVRVTILGSMDKVFISILDHKGDLMVKNKFTPKEPFTIPFDLSQLPVGTYQVKIETKEEVIVFEVETLKKKEIVKPLMAYGKLKNSNTITLLVVGLEKPGVRVEIYNQHNQQLISEYIDQPEGFSKDYQFRGTNAHTAYFRLEDSQGRTRFVYPKAPHSEGKKH